MIEILNFVAMIIGYFFILYLCFSIHLREEHITFLFLGFGFVYAETEDMRNFLNSLRKTRNKKFFLTAPVWFNRHVWNIGGIK